MSSIHVAIDKFEEVANAFASLRYFIYGKYADIGNYRDKDYPALLVEDEPDLLSFDIDKNKRTYKVVFNFFDLYQREDKAQADPQRYEGDIELLAWQYMKELKTQLKTNATIKIIEPITDGGGYSFNTGKDRTLRHQIILRITVWGDCTLGSFSYGT